MFFYIFFYKFFFVNKSGLKLTIIKKNLLNNQLSAFFNNQLARLSSQTNIKFTNFFKLFYFNKIIIISFNYYINKFFLFKLGFLFSKFNVNFFLVNLKSLFLLKIILFILKKKKKYLFIADKFIKNSYFKLLITHRIVYFMYFCLNQLMLICLINRIVFIKYLYSVFKFLG